MQWKEDRAIPRDELLNMAKGADGILCLLTDKIDAEVLDAAGTLKGTIYWSGSLSIHHLRKGANVERPLACHYRF